MTEEENEAFQQWLECMTDDDIKLSGCLLAKMHDEYQVKKRKKHGKVH